MIDGTTCFHEGGYGLAEEQWIVHVANQVALGQFIAVGKPGNGQEGSLAEATSSQPGLGKVRVEQEQRSIGNDLECGEW